MTEAGVGVTGEGVGYEVGRGGNDVGGSGI